MKITNVVAERSTCCRIQTGAVLVADKNIISVGYNGALSGEEHCCDYWYKKWNDADFKDKVSWEEYLTSPEFLEHHHQWSLQNEFHAETNCILWSSKRGVSTLGTTMYSVYSPCLSCAKVIISAGIKEVYFRIKYERDTTGIDLLKKHNIPCNMIATI